MSDSRFDKDPRDTTRHDGRQNDARAHDARDMKRTPDDLRYEGQTLSRMSDRLTGERGIARYLGSQC